MFFLHIHMDPEKLLLLLYFKDIRHLCGGTQQRLVTGIAGIDVFTQEYLL